MKKLLVLIGTVVCWGGVVHAYMSPELGRWPSRDPIWEPGARLLREPRLALSQETMSARADAAYVAFLNSPVLFYDALGLVAWRKKECVGCNASAASVTAGVIHGGDPWTCKFFDSSWWSGNFEQFNHWCRPDTLYSSVCNTKTYIEMKMKNRRCCCKSERFNIVCKVRYHARVLAQDQLEAVIKVKFLGTYDTLASAYRPSPTEAPGAGYAEEINPAPKAYTAASVRVPCKEEKVVIKLSPRVIMHGKPGFIKEKGSVYCSAVCVE